MSSEDQESKENLAPSTKTKDIWSLLKDQKEKKNADETQNVESYLFFAGSSNCGKSTIIAKFLDKDETPNPTVALEYTFGRRTRGQGGIKDVVHIYELAGGIRLSDLLNVPINEANIHNSTFVLTVDLSKPDEMIGILEHFLFSVKANIDAILDRLEERGSKRPKALRAHALKRFGAEHPDIELVQSFPVPLLIIGTKYDSLKSTESELRKVICKTLRYIAHSNGASLLFHSNTDESLNSKSRQFLSFLTFRASSPKTMIFDYNKPILILSGQDYYAQIGSPSSNGKKSDTVGKQQVYPFEAWKDEFAKYFPPKTESIENTYEVNTSLFPETAIDSLRERKDMELEKIRANNERKEKDALSTLKDNRKGVKSYSRARAAKMTVAAQ